MTDVALIWNSAIGEADLAMAGGDLLPDAGLRTAVIVSLFTDAPAQPGDEIPDGTSDSRGWWGDMAVDPAQQDVSAPADHIGSRLWLLDRALQTDETLVRAQAYAKQALQWMLDDNVAGAVTATAFYPALGRIELAIGLDQAGSSVKYAFAWSIGAPAS
jgi:phage gp46-like protein